MHAQGCFLLVEAINSTEGLILTPDDEKNEDIVKKGLHFEKKMTPIFYRHDYKVLFCFFAISCEFEII